MSAGGGHVVFSAYEEDGYNIYSLDTAQAIAGMPLVDLPIHAGVLPPRRTPAGPVFSTLENPVGGLSAPTVKPADPYKPKLALDYAGQPTIGIGTDPFGTYASGGVFVPVQRHSSGTTFSPRRGQVRTGFTSSAGAPFTSIAGIDGTGASSRSDPDFFRR